ncbi:Uncharacterised protein [Bordetella pertussis]|nr:Uncharacterised protein [Bordetella pertussis]
MTRRKGCTMRTSACSTFSALSSAVMKVITRKILNSSLAATKLAVKMPTSAWMGLPVKASTTRKVPSTDGTTTLARKTIVRMMATTLSRYTQWAAPSTTSDCIPLPLVHARAGARAQTVYYI